MDIPILAFLCSYSPPLPLFRQHVEHFTLDDLRHYLALISGAGPDVHISVRIIYYGLNPFRLDFRLVSCTIREGVGLINLLRGEGSTGRNGRSHAHKATATANAATKIPALSLFIAEAKAQQTIQEVCHRCDTRFSHSSYCGRLRQGI